jgi:hypothetical protein
MCKEKFEALIPQAQLRPSDLILRTYMKEVVRVILRTYMKEVVRVTGMTYVDVRLIDQTRTCRLSVVKGNHDSIFGLDWILSFKLNWEELLGEAAVQPLNYRGQTPAIRAADGKLYQNISGRNLQDYWDHNTNFGEGRFTPSCFCDVTTDQLRVRTFGKRKNNKGKLFRL